MLKNALLVAACALSLLNPAFAQLPAGLKCKFVTCVHGPLCENEFATGALVIQLKTPEGTGPGTILKQASNTDKVTLELTSGDQVDTLTFLKDDMDHLARGTKRSVRGLREMGYWYMDGDHVHAVTVVECTRQ